MIPLIYLILFFSLNPAYWFLFLAYLFSENLYIKHLIKAKDDENNKNWK